MSIRLSIDLLRASVDSHVVSPLDPSAAATRVLLHNSNRRPICNKRRQRLSNIQERAHKTAKTPKNSKWAASTTRESLRPFTSIRSPTTITKSRGRTLYRNRQQKICSDSNLQTPPPPCQPRARNFVHSKHNHSRLVIRSPAPGNSL